MAGLDPGYLPWSDPEGRAGEKATARRREGRDGLMNYKGTAIYGATICVGCITARG